MDDLTGAVESAQKGRNEVKDKMQDVSNSLDELRRTFDEKSAYCVELEKKKAVLEGSLENATSERKRYMKTCSVSNTCIMQSLCMVLSVKNLHWSLAGLEINFFWLLARK